MGHIIAALDLGTSKSTVFIAKKSISSKLSVLFSETINSKKAIRRGRVYNLDETCEVISQFVKILNSNPSLQVEKIYMGIGGQSLHTQSFSSKRIIDNGIITYQILDSLKEEAQKYTPDLEENLGVFSCDFYADGQLVSNPRGITASVLEAQFQLIVGNPCLKLYLENVINKNNISVAGYIISPLATAEAVLTPEEKESGCALVEFGEGVTYVSLYKNKSLKYLTTIPLGGLTITKDIRSLNVSEDEAEALKIKYGSAISKSNESGFVPADEEQNSSRKIELRDLNWIIEARVNEIVKNVIKQIEESGYSEQLDAGIVITGGGALLRDLPLFIRNLTGQNVRLAKAKVINNQIETELSPAESCVVGLAILGKDNCVKEKVSNVKEQSLSFINEMEIVKKKKEEKKVEKKKEEKVEKKIEKIIEKKEDKKTVINKSSSISNIINIFQNKIEDLFEYEDTESLTKENTEDNNANNNQ